MRSDLAVARYIFGLLLRSRVSVLLGGAGAAMIAGSFVLTALTPGTERRTFNDAAFLALEWLAILSPLLGSTVLQVQEFEQRTLWLVLVRPPTRASYVRGRFLGLFGASALVVAGCGVLLAGLLALSRGFPEPFLVPVIVAAVAETAVLSAICGLACFLTTSYLTGFLVQSGVVVLGYLSAIYPYMIQKAGSALLKTLIWILYWVVPHLADFAVREFTNPAEDWYLTALAGYAALYSAAVIGLSILAFRRRDV